MPVTQLMAPLSPLQSLFHSILPKWIIANQNPTEFNFENSYLSNFQVIAIFLGCYISIAIILSQIVPKKSKKKKPDQQNEKVTNGRPVKPNSRGREEGGEDEPHGLLNTLFIIHNLFLSALSLTLLTLMIDRLYSLILILDEGVPTENRRFLPWICGRDLAIDGPLNTLYYLNFLTKFYELLDTLFLILRGSDLQFLHLYHHSMTLYLCYVQLGGGAAVQWVPISLNLSVHVLMYYYYALTSMGIRPWWKQWVTRLQIIQFVIDIIACYSCVGLLWTSKQTWSKGTRWALSCEGTHWAAITGISILSSYLWLFLGFYVRTYAKKKKEA